MLARLEARLDALESASRGPQVAEVEALVHVLKALRTQVHEQAAQLEWFVRLGGKARELLDDLSPEEPGDVPTMSSIASAFAPATSSASGELDIAALLAKAGIKL